MQTSIVPTQAAAIPAGLIVGDATLVDPSYQVILPNGETGTWNISQNLTDRWGELNFYRSEIKPLQPLLDDPLLFERLINQMWDDMTFVVRKDGQYGLLFELEYCTKESEELLLADHDDCEQQLAQLKSEADLRPVLQGVIAKLAEEFPGVQFCLPPKEEIVEERLGVWAFVSDNHLDEQSREKLGRAMLDVYSKVY